MAHLDVDLSIPIALLVASMVGVFIVRQVVARGGRWAKERTRRLLEQHGRLDTAGGPAADQASDP